MYTIKTLNAIARWGWQAVPEQFDVSVMPMPGLQQPAGYRPREPFEHHLQR